ncbi:lysine-specific demethylase JMJ31 isoform X2 [Ziziphus jujuba]|uniref:Lysine-specific demethylase JMJ31 isoform X2 n=1 Tax=Ziziphus jujuba TaxID=326968 RepID=A0A6P4AQL7_ZIZJJ|nr:lysine-specific demethylase JMJ31 isoform X2 [Ziziphus jujuba]
MEKPLQIRSFEVAPTAIDFESLIESANVPAVFRGCVNDWKAVFNWNPKKNGLDYLQERVGSCTVEAMLSRSAPVFYGDLRSHERVPLPFSAFIGFCKQRLQNTDGVCGPCGVNNELERNGMAESESYNESLPYDDAHQQIYLAQVPIMNIENEEHVQLEALRDDIQMPIFLEEKVLSSINLWMNNAEARSMVLWPPSASPTLYPMAIYGEASNHSSVALENPNFSIYPRAKCLMEYSQTVILHAGDALFIPEGWFHQVDSDEMTIAVNFWWRSNIMSSMLEHMDSYYLRRILRRLTDREMDEALRKDSSAEMPKTKMNMCELLDKREGDNSTDNQNQTCEEWDLNGTQEQRNTLHELEPFSIQALHELVSLVHDSVNIADHVEPVQSTSTADSTASVKVEYKKTMTTDSFSLEDDPVAKILWTLDSCTLQSVFLAMARNFPRTLEALILHLLSPVGAEVLTRKFDEIDRRTTEDDRNKFYKVFYGAFDDQFAAMDAILNGKESFALQAFRNVLDKFVGFDLGGPTRGLR